MKEPAPLNCSPVAVLELHQLYCQLTAQKLSLRFDRERLWYEFLCAGFSAADLEQTIAYRQREIRAQRRNIGALKLSNLLQLDRFEEDLNISERVSGPQPRNVQNLHRSHLHPHRSTSNNTRQCSNSFVTSESGSPATPE
jgi:hypothetical protein